MPDAPNRNTPITACDNETCNGDAVANETQRLRPEGLLTFDLPAALRILDEERSR